MNYYNENDPKASAWLRELIRAGEIPDGHVDTRSIGDVQPADLRGFTQCHFFAGIGGWSLALRLAGWPADRPVWTGSCPCQPFSSAGKQQAQADERHLWPVFFRLVAQCRPDVVFGEQVASAIGHGWLDGISADLEAEGYACGPVVLGAHSVGAPHQRQRLYWVADTGRERRGGFDEPHGQTGEGRTAIEQRSAIVRLADTECDAGRPGRTPDQSGEGAGATVERPHAEPGRCGVPGHQPLADADLGAGGQRGEIDGVRDQGSAAQQRPGSGGGGVLGGLADTHGDRCDQGRRGQSTAGLHGTLGNGGAGSVGHAAGDDQRRDSLPGTHGQRQPAGGSSGPGGSNPERMGSPIRSGLEGHAGHGHHGHEPGRIGTLTAGSIAPAGRPGDPLAGAWADFDLLPCLDGKARRVESGTFPLAHGVPARVVRLRGYGNAIVPQVAAAFIQAWEETRNL